ncbi:MAG: PKD domain-containing protein [Agriterribacter sp.]
MKAVPVDLTANIGGLYESLPVDYTSQPSKKYPLLIFLHGTGERGNGTTDISKLATTGLPKYIKDGLFPSSLTVGGEKFSFIVICPQVKLATDIVNGIQKTIEYAIKNYRVDEERIYLTGLSLGGLSSWFYAQYAQTYSEKLAAMMLVCPGVDSSYYGGTALGRKRITNVVNAHLPVWITTNSNDPLAKTWQQIALADSINKLNPTPKAKLTIFQANGHDAWTKTYNPTFTEDGMNVYEWMLTYKRTIILPPVADAGSAQTISLPTTTVTLDGSKSTAPSGTIKSYAWTKLSGPSSLTISSPSSVSTKVTNLVEGTYEFRLTITDSNGKTAVSTVIVKVTATPLPPVANAGSPQTITLPSNSITLNGSASTASSGTIVSYQWTKISGPAQGTIANASSTITSVTNLIQGVYVFQLKVTDSNGGTSTASVSITVNAAPVPPVADAGDAQIINLPTDVATIDGSASTAPAGSITKYEWSKISGPAGGTLSNAGIAKTLVTGLKEGVYEFQLKVTDDKGSTSVDVVTITVNPAPAPPVANAGSNKTIQLPANAVTLDGSASTAPAGTITDYKWTKISGPSTGVINDPVNVNTTVTALIAGIYVFELQVTDNNGNSSIATVTVTVNPAPLPPVANAGVNQTISLPQSDVILDGSNSGAQSGSIVSYEWSKISGPSGEIITSASVVSTTVTGLVEGVYVFGLKITDSNGQSSTGTVTITVNAAPLPPVANAGSDQTITLPVNSVSLDAGGSTAPSGSIVSYEWSKISGPSLGSLSSATIVNPQATALGEGVYKFQVKVTDNNGQSSTGTVTITVKAAPLPPVANAGNAQTITLPVNSVSIDGSKSTASSGSIVSYAWTKVSGPSAGTISDPGNAVTTVTDLEEGVYQFELKVTDSNGQSTTATVTITVKAIVVPPVANAGSDIEITLPVNTVTLDGSNSTASGNIVSYAWTKASGPSDGAIANASGASTAVNNLAEGEYEFELKVTDNNGWSATATIKVKVKAALPAPVADAGMDQTISLPQSDVTLDGSNSSAQSGSIVSYEWSKISGPSGGIITSASVVSTTVTGLAEGVYVFGLKITDSNGQSSTGTVTITVNAAPLPPVANAGSDQTITLPVNSVSLDAGGSTAPSGSIVSYEWSKISGPSLGSLSSATIVNPQATALGEGVYKFQVKVTDNNGQSSTGTVTITVKAAPLPPVANAGNAQTITLPVNSVILDAGSSTAPSGNIVSYEWSKVSGPVDGTLASGSVYNPQANGLVEGIYKFQVKVTDNNGLNSTATVTVTVKAAPLPPVANAGAAQTIVLPQSSVKLDGSKSTASSGTIVSYEWKQLSGGTAVIADAGLSGTLVSDLSEGVYQFELKVTDSNGQSTTATVTVTVKATPPPPIANAGISQTITLPASSAVLDGRKSTAAAGSIVSYEWSLLAGPEGSEIEEPGASVSLVNNLVEGIYQFQLKVTDNIGGTATSVVVIAVKGLPVPPIADAGLAQTITLPVNTATLNATLSTAPSGSIKNYVWTKLSGPSEGEITNPNSSMTTAVNLVAGVYQFQVKVIDNNNNSSLATATITVNPAVVKPPVADAGKDQQIQLPANVIQLDGSKSYAQEGSIKSYSWVVVSASVPVSLLNATTSMPSVLSVQEGVYTFRLYVTDTYNTVDSADVTVAVVPKNVSPEPPVAYIISDTTVSLPQTTTLLDGSASYSVDKIIVKYEWSIISGPEGAVIESMTNAITSVSSLTEGAYQFALTVTDDKGGVAQSVVTVIVNNPGGRPDLSQTMQVYPNPAQNIVNIKLSGESKGRTMIDVYDVTGKKALHKEVIKDNNTFFQTIDVSDLKKGVYLIEIIVDYRYRSTYKLVKL